MSDISRLQELAGIPSTFVPVLTEREKKDFTVNEESEEEKYERLETAYHTGDEKGLAKAMGMTTDQLEEIIDDLAAMSHEWSGTVLTADDDRQTIIDRIMDLAADGTYDRITEMFERGEMTTEDWAEVGDAIKKGYDWFKNGKIRTHTEKYGFKRPWLSVDLDNKIRSKFPDWNKGGAPLRSKPLMQSQEITNELNVPQSKEKVKAQIKKLMDMADKARADGDPNRAYSIERSSEMLALQKKLSKLGEEITQEAVGEFAEPLYTLQDELGLEDNILVDELARWMDGQDISEFVDTFRRHHEMPEDDTNFESTSKEWTDADATNAASDEKLIKKAVNRKRNYNDDGIAPPKGHHNNTSNRWAESYSEGPDWLSDCHGAAPDGDIDENNQARCGHCGEYAMFAPVEESVTEAQSPAQKAAFAKMLAAKNGDKPVDEAKAKPDFADIDGDGDEKETMKKAAKDKKLKNEQKIEEAPTMDTTKLITLMKNAGLSEEAIEEKINEWANSPEDASELEPTSHGEAYDFAQNVNTSLKKYLDAQDMKVGITEHTVAEITEAYKESKNKV